MNNFSTNQISTTSATMTERKGTTELKLTPVFLHVYVIDHKLNPPLLRIGVGMYHSAVEIQFSDAIPREYSFGVNGLFQNTPKQGCGCTYLKSIMLGYTSLQLRDVENIVENMQRDQYNEEAYNILLRNCNHFTNEFARFVVQYKDKEGKKKLRRKKRHVPRFVNRIAQLGSKFACFFSKDFLKGRSKEFEVPDVPNSPSPQMMPLSNTGFDMEGLQVCCENQTADAPPKTQFK